MRGPGSSHGGLETISSGRTWSFSTTSREPLPAKLGSGVGWAVESRGPSRVSGLTVAVAGDNEVMARYAVNERALRRARELIEARQYVLDSDWGLAQPDAEAENAFLERHSWDEYATWHLGLTEGASEETKARYGFVFGDFRRVHRSGLIACVYRASEWRHKAVELAAHELLQRLDQTSSSA